MKFARITTATVPRDKLAEFTHVYETTILPALKPVTGFQGAVMCTNESTEEGFSLTFWASEQDAIAYEQSGLYAKLIEQLRPFFTSQPILKSYQVAAEAAVPATVRG